MVLLELLQALHKQGNNHKGAIGGSPNHSIGLLHRDSQSGHC